MKNKKIEAAPEVYNHVPYQEPELSIGTKIIVWLIYAIIMILLVYLFFEAGWHL